MARVRAVEDPGESVGERAGQTKLAEWVEVWSAAHDVSAGTWAKYRSHLRNHILPRFGDEAVADISKMEVKAWVKSLRRKLAEPTVADVATLLSQLLGKRWTRVSSPRTRAANCA